MQFSSKQLCKNRSNHCQIHLFNQQNLPNKKFWLKKKKKITLSAPQSASNQIQKPQKDSTSDPTPHKSKWICYDCTQYIEHVNECTHIGTGKEFFKRVTLMLPDSQKKTQVQEELYCNRKYMELRSEEKGNWEHEKGCFDCWKQNLVNLTTNCAIHGNAQIIDVVLVFFDPQQSAAVMKKPIPSSPDGFWNFLY